jgi:CRISPR system Cascade subunit CasC
MFLQIHTLTAFPASLLNRDDAGLAKRISFGNAMRLRVSSQCLKRHWRENLTARLSDLPDGWRTRSFFTRVVLPKAIDSGIPQDIAEKLIEPLVKGVFSNKKGNDQAENSGGTSKGKGDLKQPVLFGLREADYFVQMLVDVSSTKDPEKALKNWLKSKEEKDNLKAMCKSALESAGLTATLFGRMVTSDLLARVDGAVHVAHAFTVHPANTEMDYFSVVDDLNRDDETGSAHNNYTELGAGLYYGYVVVDVPLLVSNLTAAPPEKWRSQDATTARRVLETLIDAILRQSPGAKKGSTAPYAWADALYLETGRSQPRTLANAYLQALRTDGKADPRQAALERLADYVKQLDKMYGPPAQGEGRHLATVLPQPAHLPEKQSVPDAVRAALDAIFSSNA